MLFAAMLRRAYEKFGFSNAAACDARIALVFMIAGAANGPITAVSSAVGANDCFAASHGDAVPGKPLSNAAVPAAVAACAGSWVASARSTPRPIAPHSDGSAYDSKPFAKAPRCTAASV